MPSPRLTKENGAPNLDVLPDVLVEKSPAVPVFLAGYQSESAVMLFILTLGQMETGQESDDQANNLQLCSGGNVKYFEAAHQGHRTLTRAVNRSDGNGLTVKLYAAASQNNILLVVRK